MNGRRPQTPRGPALLAFDIDGTVLGQGDVPVPGVAPVLCELAEAGVLLVPVTGRPLHGALKAAGELGVAPAACVAYHGALVVDLVSGEWLRHLTVPADLAAELAAAGLAGGLDVSLYVGDERRDLPAGWAPPAAAGRPPEVAGVTRLVLAGDPQRVSPAMPALAQARAAGLRVEPVRPGVVVVLPAGTDKGEGLRLVAAHLGVPRARVVACGDAAGDVTLLRAAAVGIAAGDAPEELRAAATLTVGASGLPGALLQVFARLP